MTGPTLQLAREGQSHHGRQAAVFRAALFAIGAMCLAGCSSIGPRTVPRDRADYSNTISDSWKRQTLMNIVKLRYLEPPAFVDVGQIVSGYSLEMAGVAGGQLSSVRAMQGNSLNLGGSLKYTDRPTITYTPLTGDKFIKGLMTPLPPDSVFFMIQSGWPADAVCFASVAAMNGLKNQVSDVNGVAPPDPEFQRALGLLRKLQVSGAVTMRVEKNAQKQQTTVIVLRSKGMSEETLADAHELRRLLHLDPDATELKLVFGAAATDERELAVLTRSLLQIMNTMAVQVEVPAKHVSEGRATPGYDRATHVPERQRLVRILSSKHKPADAYVSVQYRDHWFWIDDCDLHTKRAFAFMMMLFTLADTGTRDNLPLITIPAQ